MLMVVIPYMSWTILLTITVDAISQGRACSSASRGWDDWFLLRVLAISVNPDQGVHSGDLVLSSGVSTLGLNMAIPANLGGGICLGVPGLPGDVFTH